MSLNRIVREGVHMHTVSDRKNGIARIQERLEWISIELKAIDTLLRSTLKRPLFPQIIDPDEKMNVAVYRQLALEPEDQNYLEDELMQTETERLSSYPNWDLKCIFIENISDRIAGKQCLREMMEQVRQGEFDLIITDSVRSFSDDPDEVLIYVDMLRDLPHPVYVLFERERIYTKTDHDLLLQRGRRKPHE